MVDRIGIKRMYEAEVICSLREMRQQLAHPHTVLSRLRKLEHRRRHQLLPATRHGRHPLALADGLGQLLLEELVQVRLVIKEVHLARGAGHEKENHSLRLGSPRQTKVPRHRALRLRRQRRQRRRAQPHAAVQQKRPPRLQLLRFGQ